MSKEFLTQRYLESHLYLDLLTCNLGHMMLFGLLNSILQILNLSFIHFKFVIDLTAQGRVLNVFPLDVCVAQFAVVSEVPVFRL